MRIAVVLCLSTVAIISGFVREKTRESRMTTVFMCVDNAELIAVENPGLNLNIRVRVASYRQLVS
jgi:hypothetical protein